MEKTEFRNNGAVGALLDEYERAVNQLQDLLSAISNEQMMQVVDKDAENPECVSIHTILTHVLKAGNWYNIEIRKAEGEDLERPESISYDTISDYQTNLNLLIASTEQIFNDYPNIDLYVERAFRWKNIRSVDMLLEHAIVHILRHRRQIERFLLKMKQSRNNSLLIL